MTAPRLYISVPCISDLSRRASSFMERYQSLYGFGYGDQKHIKDCDGVVFFLPNNHWGVRITTLSSDQQVDLELALNGNKQILLAYRTSAGNHTFYEAKVTSTLIEGISGTSLSTTEVSKLLFADLDDLYDDNGNLKMDLGVEYSDPDTILLHHGR